MEQEKIKVLMVQPNQYPKQIEITDTLDDLQKAVNGLIEVTYPYKGDNVGLVLNDEGKLMGLPMNRALRDSKDRIYDGIAGSFLVVGLEGDHFCSLTQKQMVKYEKLFHQPELFVRMGRNMYVLPVADEFVGRDVPDMVKVPVYRQSLQTAEAYGQVQGYRLSFQANKLCKDRIEAVIKENFDGSHLNPQGAKQILSEFGVKRVEYVLASTVQVKDWDGRFSPSNKSWANSVPTVSDMRNGLDRRTDYAVQSHPAILDGFISQVREEIKAMEQPKASTLEAKLAEAKDTVAKQEVTQPAVKHKSQDQSL